MQTSVVIFIVTQLTYIHECLQKQSPCISINEQVVHGMPSDRTLEAGDIVSIDIGLKLKGWCSDCAVTRAVGKVSDEKQQLMNTTNWQSNS